MSYGAKDLETYCRCFTCVHYWVRKWSFKSSQPQNTLLIHPHLKWKCKRLGERFSIKHRWGPPPPHTHTATSIPHIEVGFQWMWTILATPNKMAPVFVDLFAGLGVLLPRQIRRFRHGFFSSAVLDWGFVFAWGTFKGNKSRTIDGIFVDLSYPQHRHYEVKSGCRSTGKATMVNLLTKQYQTSSLSSPWVRNLDFETSL